MIKSIADINKANDEQYSYAVRLRDPKTNKVSTHHIHNTSESHKEVLERAGKEKGKQPVSSYRIDPKTGKGLGNQRNFKPSDGALRSTVNVVSGAVREVGAKALEEGKRVANSDYAKPVNSVTAADINRMNDAQYGKDAKVKIEVNPKRDIYHKVTEGKHTSYSKNNSPIERHQIPAEELKKLGE